MGSRSLSKNTKGSYNTAVGYNALAADTAQNKNTAVGYYAGNNFVSTASTYLGHGAAPLVALIDNSMALGFSATVPQVTRSAWATVRLKVSGVTWALAISQMGVTKENMKENVPGLEFINKLRPLTYTLDIEGIEKKMSVYGCQSQHYLQELLTRKGQHVVKKVKLFILVLLPRKLKQLLRKWNMTLAVWMLPKMIRTYMD